MSLVHDILLQNLPAKQRITPKGWRIFNSPCCANKGHRPDTRMRGNLKIGEDGTIGGNCYNCGFKFRFDGHTLSAPFEQFLGWLGVDRHQIQSIKMELLKKNIDGDQTRSQEIRSHSWGQRWPTIELPDGSRPIESVLEDDELDENFIEVVNYLQTRGSAIAAGYDYFWCNSPKHDLNKRLILPFYHQNKIIGYTARYAGTPPSGIPKYWNSDIPSGFLFNNDVSELTDRKYMVLVEGPFDAIAMQGVGAMGSTLSADQIHWLSTQPAQKIVLPDRQRKNQELIDTALLFGWSVSFPEWEDDIKDAADACKKYGQIYTITSVLAAQTTDPVMIGIKRKMFKG